ncbi:MAG: DUF2867 domain-containing protein [Anaerolineae bacterium]|nr:DUF2867 domain-containing protein [Anaerolineae bacterium]
MKQAYIFTEMPELTALMSGADHVDVKTVTGACSLPEFIAGMFSYYPGWVKSLYRIRWGFVRLLGMKQQGIPTQVYMRPEDVPMTPGEKAAFFTVTMAEVDRYWVAEANESHLTAYLGVVMTPLADNNRFDVVTIVRYRRWTGPVYFNVIRPFHHIVVQKMAQAGAAKPTSLLTTTEGMTRS